VKGLLIKDFVYLKPLQKVSLILVCSLMFLANDILLAMSYVVLMSSLFVRVTFTYDEQMGGMKYILTLPVTRAQYVGSKYIFILGMHGCALLGGVVLRLLFRREIDGLFTWLGSGVALYMAMTALLMPLFLGLHGKRRENVMTIIALVPFGLMLLRQRIGWAAEVSAPSGMYLLLLLIGSIVLLVLSYCISLRIIEKKEY